MGRVLGLGLLAGVGVLVVATLYDSERSLGRAFTETSTIRPSIQQSAVYRHIVNPSSSPILGSSHSVVIRRPRQLDDGPLL